MDVYGKLIDGVFVKAPKKIRYHGKLVINPRPEKLIELGYKLLVADPYPSADLPDNFYWITYYEEDEHNIYRKFEYIEIVDEDV